MSELPAGRELDALIAEMVMGWAWHKHPDQDIRYFRPPDVFRYGGVSQGDLVEYTDQLPHYSADIAAAWLVVEWMRAHVPDYRAVRIETTGIGYMVAFYSHKHRLDRIGAFSHGETISIAICRAALKAFI